MIAVLPFCRRRSGRSQARGQLHGRERLVRRPRVFAGECVPTRAAAEGRRRLRGQLGSAPSSTSRRISSGSPPRAAMKRAWPDEVERCDADVRSAVTHRVHICSGAPSAS